MEEFSTNNIYGFRSEIDDITWPIMYFDLNKFGKHFKRCTGSINSRVEKSERDKAGLIWSVGKTIGVTDPFAVNAIHAKDKEVFVMLVSEHIDLTNNATKKQTCLDFLLLKQEIIRRYLSLFDDEIAPHFKTDITVQFVQGMQLGTRDVSYIQDKYRVKSNDIRILGDGYKNMQRSTRIVGLHNRHELVCGDVGSLHLGIYRVSDDRILFNVYLQTDWVHCYNADNILNYDFLEIFNQITEKWNRFVTWYETELHNLREKYIVEYTVNSFGDEDCLI